MTRLEHPVHLSAFHESDDVLRILIIEDQLIVAYGSEAILTSAGHEVVGIATSGAQALALMGDAPPDLALVDVRLSDEGTGVTIAQWLFQDFGVRTLFATGNPDECRPGALHISAVGCLHKPFHEADLLAAIRVAEQIIRGVRPPRTPDLLEVY